MILNLLFAFGGAIGISESVLVDTTVQSQISAPPYVAYGNPPQLYYQGTTSHPSVPQRLPVKLAETSPKHSQLSSTRVQNDISVHPNRDVPVNVQLANKYVPDVSLATGSLPSKPTARQIDGDNTHLAKVVSLGPAATATGMSTVPYHLRNIPTPNNNELIPGEVFKLITLSDDPEFDNETVVIYRDGTLGIAEPDGPGYMFQGLLLSEYGLLFAPEPLRTVKFNDKRVFFLNESLYNPAPVFVADKWTLLLNGGQAAICPSWNSVLVSVSDSEPAPCDDWVNVKLHIVPLSV